MTTSSDRWQRLQTLFESALALPLDERSAFLDDACGEAPFLRREVEGMLAAQAPDRALVIERMVNDEPSLARKTDPCDAGGRTDPFVGTRLGPWRVIELVGRGGMGTVYLAERADGRYEQRVALKLVRSAATPGPALSRFQAECQILARLSHPNIARLLDAGFTPEGSAYLVMEYVDGCAITTYCDERRLTVDERLTLFRTVCAATQHAHQSLVVHRDLKPSNIFVSRTGEVKLLDFGIAKLVSSDSPAAEATAVELRALTPSYAAPEQLRGDPVTTATDVYVLGVVLYELLTGCRPFEGAVGVGGPGGGLPAGAEPDAPSQAVRRVSPVPRGAARDDGEDLATKRGASRARLARRLSGDIDRVVLQALRPEAERRYGSAGQLAEEIDRLLEGLPVIAQRDTLAYRTRRFITRHRLGVAVGVVVAVLITTFAVVAAVQARAAARERDRAQVEATRARRVSLLTADIFRLAEPRAGQGDTITARELLDRGTERIAVELADDAQAQAELYTVIGRVYANLALHDRAIRVLAHALALQRRLQGPAGPAVAETLHLLGEQSVRKNDYATAIEYFREALSLRRRLDAEPAQIADALEGLGRALSFSGSHDEAEAPLREAVRIRRALPDHSAAETMSTLQELALALHRQGDFKNAETFFREAVDEGRQVPDQTPAKVIGLLHLARLIHRFDRDPARAEPIYREALTAARALYPNDHPDVATCLGELARDVRDLGRLDEAEALAREGLAMFRRLYGTPHREVILTTRTLADVLREQEKTGEAESLSREALAAAESLFSEAHPMTLGARGALATVLEQQRRYDEALTLREKGLAAARKAFGENNVFVAIALTGLGQHGLAAGRIEDGVVYLQRALAIRQRLHDEGHWRVDDARVQLGRALGRAGRLAEAEPLLRDGYAGLRRSRGAQAKETRDAWQWLGELKRARAETGA